MKRPKLPGTFVNLLVDVLHKRGISSEQLFAGIGISIQNLELPFWYIDLHLFNVLLEKAVSLSRDPAISLILAKEVKVSCYGHIGVAAKASENLGEAICVLEQYISLYCTVFNPQLIIDKEKAYLYIKQPSQDLDFNHHLNMFLVFGFAYILESLVQRRLNIKLEFKEPYPSFHENLKVKTHMTYEFNRKVNGLSFKTEFLKLPLNSADKTIARLARSLCESHIKNNTFYRKGGDEITNAVKESLYDEMDGFLSFKEVAKKIHISERTLQRQLSAENTTFNKLLAEVKQTKAEYWLKQKNIAINEVAYRLGYADLSHFSRAFKKWTNVTPKFYRVQQAC
ncbi:AraC family transcriptional regulator [Acinetobacter courvalinii]|nr:AraC family transcriptional regulator [Acinetobacter courvalinii]